MSIDKRIDDYNWEHIFENYTGEYRRHNVAKIVAIDDGANDEANWIGLFEMTDGKFLTVDAGCDYTGWGCQESGDRSVHNTLADAIFMGLTVSDRDRMKDQLKVRP